MIISVSQDDILRVIGAIKKNSKENVECAGQGMPFVKTKVVDADYVLTMLQELIEKEDDNLCNSCTNIGTVEAIPKADYEARLRADMAAMLTEIQLEIEESENCGKAFHLGLQMASNIIQQKINALKGDLE